MSTNYPEDDYLNDEDDGSRPGAADDSKDITPVLNGWGYEAGAINVRKIAGIDGREKLQMRLDLGLLQMEVHGRPDGVRPHGRESYLDYFEERLKGHAKRHGSDRGFELDADECQHLREEAVMYYHRYLSLFILGDFPGVIRDTARNLRVLDICGEYAADESDRFVLEQYRPYIIMMNTRATASLQFKAGQYKSAYQTVTRGLERIREFFVRFAQREAFDKSNEVRILKRFAKEIRRKLPVDPVEKLENKLQRAIKREDYEKAAKLRDEIQVRKAQRESSGA